MSNKYKRISEFRKQLSDGARIEDTDELQMMYLIDVFFEAEVYKKYEGFVKFCKERGFNRVFDIGAAYGLQSECFIGQGVDYVGIDIGTSNFWNDDKYEYISGKYPFQINTRSGDIAISSLCLTWNIYLLEGEKTLREQCEALSRDFKHCLLYMQMDKLDIVNEYFAHHERIDSNTVYFSN